MSARTLAWSVVTCVARVPNPVPWIAPGGDCGPSALCCAAGLGPERVPDLYRLAGVDPPRGWDLYDMHSALDVLLAEGQIREWSDRPLVPRPEPRRLYPGVWGYPGHVLHDDWVHDLRAHLEAGWAALTVIDQAGRGPAAGEGDHWVVLAGLRGIWRDGVLCHEVRVVSSSASDRGDWWEDVGRFLRECGGFRVIYVLPRRRWQVVIP